MKKLVPIIIITLCILAESTAQIEIITYNIRLNTPVDGEHAWPNRRENVAALLKFHRAGIFCVQEALPEQITDLSDAFPAFKYEGAGRDDGKKEGEFSAIFFNEKIFRQMDGGTFWLSETPDECSFGWDAACRRVCTWVQLEDITSGKKFFVFNTHFDHLGTEARQQSAGLIIKQIEKIAGNGPVVLCGDFNLSPDSEPIGEIKQVLNDAYEITETPPYGPVLTYMGFTYDSQPGQRIDYIFVSGDVEVLRYGVLTDSKERKFYSDHLPVLVTVFIK